MSSLNAHDPKYREAKVPQASPSTPVADLFRLTGRTIIVTGGAGALGSAVVSAVLEGGGDVVCIDVVKAPNDAVWGPLQELSQKSKTALTYHQCDVTSEEDVTRVFAEVLPTLTHPVRGLVQCVGVSDNYPVVDFPADKFKRLFDINVAGTFIVAQAVAREVIKTGNSASMVLIGSVSGSVSNRGTDNAGYNSSKAAVLQLARSLAAEWGGRVGIPLIRVNTISPGYIRTPALQVALDRPGLEEQVVGDHMLYRLSTVDEYRAPVLFLLGDGSSFVTGTDLRVDGGYCAW